MAPARTNASHGLRSPLARIRMGLALMGQGTAAPTAERARRHEIARSIDELDESINEILLASRHGAQHRAAAGAGPRPAAATLAVPPAGERATL